jgi:hypothetical protein
MLDGDGQRPEAIEQLGPHVNLVQVTLEGVVPDGMVERALETLRAAAAARMEHALVIGADERMSDPQLMRLVEQAHAASSATTVVIHPGPAVPVDRDRRWITVLERATGIHTDVRIGLRLPAPTGMR